MLTLFLGIITVFLCIMLIVNSALSSKRLVGVVKKFHELRDGYENKIKELESSPLFDCENGKHHWMPWEDVPEEGRKKKEVTQSRRCGECNKLECSKVMVSEVRKVPTLGDLELDMKKIEDSLTFSVKKPQSPTVTYETKVGSVTLHTDKVTSAHVDTDGYLIVTFKDGVRRKLLGVTWDGVNRWKELPREPSYTLPCTYCGGSFPHTEFTTRRDGTYHDSSGMTPHLHNKPRKDPKTKSVTATFTHLFSGDYFCEKCDGWFSGSEFAGDGSRIFHYPDYPHTLPVHDSRLNKRSYTEFATGGVTTPTTNSPGMAAHLHNTDSFGTKKISKKKSKSVTRAVDELLQGNCFCESCDDWFPFEQFGEDSRKMVYHFLPYAGGQPHRTKPRDK